MANLVKVTGVKNVIANIKRVNVKFGIGVERGLKKAGLLIQRESQKIVPVDVGNLRGGAFTRNIGGRAFDTDVIVGYTADYAVYVHEDLQAKHKKGKKAKYLEIPARITHRMEALKIIETEAKMSLRKL